MRRAFVVGTFLAALATPALALAQAPVQYVTAAGTAIDNSTIDAAGNAGPCAVSVSASREAFSGAGNDTNVGGSGSFLVSGGPGQPSNSVCGGAPVSMRFDVTKVTISGPTATIQVEVTDSDDLSIVGTTGTIIANDSTDRVDVTIGGRSGGFGPVRAVYSAFIDTIADVRIGVVQTSALTHFSGTGTATDVSVDLSLQRADCVAAVAGVTAPADGGGTFQSGLASGGDVGNCFGPEGSTYRYTVTGATTNGETLAKLTVATTDSYSGVAGPGGELTIDETANSLLYDVPPHAGGFFQPGLFGIIATRAGARVDTKTFVGANTPCSVNGGGILDGQRNFGLNARFSGSRLHGQVNFLDHGLGLHVRSRELSSLVCSGTSATLRGTADTDAGPQQFRIDVNDAGEPGRSDTFTIQLFPSGYTATGTLRGGNIQVRAG